LAVFPAGFFLSLSKRFVIVRDGSAIGDHVLMTGLVRFLFEEFDSKSIVITTHPEIFYNHPCVSRVVDLRSIPSPLRKLLLGLASAGSSSRFFMFRFNRFRRFGVWGETLEEYMKRTQSRIHLRDLGVMHTSHAKRLMRERPDNEVHLSAEEINVFSRKFRSLPRDYALITSKSRMDYTPLKDWGASNMQSVVDSTKSRVAWVQVGSSSDPKLKDVIDIRGKTGFRELSFVISRARLIVCNEGLFTHLSSAFKTPCITVFSCFHPPEISAYPNVIPVTAPINHPYSWSDSCVRNPHCLKRLSPEKVTRVVLKVLNSKDAHKYINPKKSLKR
jgi:hypothetical protein